MKLEHVNLTVSDVEKSSRFYCELLDLKVRWRGQTGAGWEAVHIGDDDAYLAMFQSPKPVPAEEDYERLGLNHVGFIVDDLAEAKRRLQRLGVAPKSEQDYDPGKRLYFFDPDGIEVELVEYAN